MSSPASRSSSKNDSGASTIRWPCSVQLGDGRSEATTTEPSAIGGTKWPSMMSTWMTSAYGSTSLTWSPRRARSAARIDAESLPIAAYRTRRSSADRPLSRSARTPPRTSRRSRGGAATADGAPTRPSGPGRCERQQVRPAAPEQRVDDRVGLRPRERAHRVDEPAAGAQQVRRRRGRSRAGAPARVVSRSSCTRHSSSGRRRAEPRPLHGASTSTRSNPPAGSAGERASCTTIQRRRPRRRAASRSIARVRRSWTSAATTTPSGPTGATVEQRLAPRRRADVEHALARPRVERPHHEHARLVLHGERPLAKPGSRAGSPPATSRPPRRARPGSASTPARREPVEGGAAIVRAQAERGARGERRCGGLRRLVAEHDARARAPPIGPDPVRQADGRVVRARRRRRAGRRRAAAAPRSRTRAPRPPARPTVSPTAAWARHVGHQELVGAQAERMRAHPGDHPRHAAGSRARLDRVVEPGWATAGCRTRARWRTRGPGVEARPRRAGPAGAGSSTRRRRSTRRITSSATCARSRGSSEAFAGREPGAARPRGGRHPPPARRRHLDQAHAALPGAHQHALGRRRRDRARWHLVVVAAAEALDG